MSNQHQSASVKTCATCGGVKDDGYVTESHFFEGDCIRELQSQNASLLERVAAAEKERDEAKAIIKNHPYYAGKTEDALECSQCDWKGYEDDAMQRQDEVEGSQYWCPECDELCAHLPVDELDITPEKFKAECNKWISRANHFALENQSLQSQLASARQQAMEFAEVVYYLESKHVDLTNNWRVLKMNLLTNMPSEFVMDAVDYLLFVGRLEKHTENEWYRLIKSATQAAPAEEVKG